MAMPAPAQSQPSQRPQQQRHPELPAPITPNGERDHELMMIGGEVFTHRNLPRWVEFIQEHLILGVLIIVEMMLNGTFMTTGIAPHDPNPLNWGIPKLIEVSTYFAGGAVIATMTVFCSFAAAIALLDRAHPRKIFGGFMLVVAIAFAAYEVWAGLYERSQQSVAAMIDLWVMRLPAGAHPLVSPTLFILAFALPLSALVVGFAVQVGKDNRIVEKMVSLEQRERIKFLKEQGKQQRKLLAAQGKGQRRVAQEVAYAQANYAANQAAQGQNWSLNSAATLPQSDSDDDPELPDPDDDPRGSGSRQTRRQSGGNYGVNSPVSRRTARALTAIEGGRAESMTADEVVDYIHDAFGREIDRQTAQYEVIKRCKYERDGSRPGRPFAAPRAEVLQRIAQFARGQGWQRLQSRSA